MFEDLQEKAKLLQGGIVSSINKLVETNERVEQKLDVIQQVTEASNVPQEILNRRFWLTYGLTISAGTTGNIDVAKVPLGAIWRIEHWTAMNNPPNTDSLQLYEDIVEPGALLATMNTGSNGPAMLNLAAPIILTESRTLVFAVIGAAATVTFNGRIQIAEYLTKPFELKRDFGDSEAPRIEGPYQTSDQEFQLSEGVKVPDERQTVTVPNIGEEKARVAK